MFPLRTILHPTDFSDRSQAAFNVACALARDQGAMLVLLHVNDSATALSADEAQVRQVDASLTKRLHSLRPEVPVVAVEYRLEKGNPPEVILNVAKEWPADVIVMGTHGHTGLTRALLGSVAEAVVRGAECPVLTMRLSTGPQSRFHEKIPSTAVPVM